MEGPRRRFPCQKELLSLSRGAVPCWVICVESKQGDHDIKDCLYRSMASVNVDLTEPPCRFWCPVDFTKGHVPWTPLVYGQGQDIPLDWRSSLDENPLADWTFAVMHEGSGIVDTYHFSRYPFAKENKYSRMLFMNHSIESSLKASSLTVPSSIANVFPCFLDCLYEDCDTGGALFALDSKVLVGL